MVLLNEGIGSHTRVDTRGWVISVTVAENMGSTESERWKSGVDVGEAVVVISDSEIALVIRVVVGVTDEGTLPLDFEIC